MNECDSQIMSALSGSLSCRNIDTVQSKNMTLRATFQRFTLADNPLPRSSHSFSVINGKGFLFGGEIQPRSPVEPAVYSIPLAPDSRSQNPLNYEISSKQDVIPDARVGHISARVNECIYVFGGRGGKDEAKPMDEAGRVWRYSTTQNRWTALEPSSSAHPSARSYHVAIGAEDLSQIFVHAGCPATGRTGDLWSFDIKSLTWKELASAPDPPRGGPGFTYALGHLYRYGGFNGKTEEGGKLDYLNIKSGEKEWKSMTFPNDGDHPSGRSVTGLQAVKVAGMNFLVAFLGERDASSQGHAGAGKFWDDVWSLALSNDGKPSEKWRQCNLTSHSDKPPARGWFASDILDNEETIVLYGGLNGLNERETDGYYIKLKLE